MTRSLGRFVLLIALVSVLGACGFQLRGSASLPTHLSPLRLVAADLNPQQLARLSQQLRRAGTDLQAKDTPQQARLSVVLQTAPDRNLVQSSGSGGQIVRVAMQLSYSLTLAGGEALVVGRDISQQMDLALADDNLLVSASERSAALLTLEQGLYQQLIFQLRQL